MLCRCFSGRSIPAGFSGHLFRGPPLADVLALQCPKRRNPPVEAGVSSCLAGRRPHLGGVCRLSSPRVLAREPRLACEAAPTSDFNVSRRVRVKFRCLTCDCFWFEGNSTTSPCMARQNSSSSPRARELLVAAGRPPAPSASRGRRRRGHALETTVVDALTNCHPQTTADVGKPATKPRRWAGTRTIAAAQKAHH